MSVYASFYAHACVYVCVSECSSSNVCMCECLSVGVQWDTLSCVFFLWFMRMTQNQQCLFSWTLCLPSAHHPHCVLCVFFPPVEHRWQTMEKDAQRDPERPHHKQQAVETQSRAPPETEAWEHVRLEILNSHQWVNLTLDLTITEPHRNPHNTITFILKLL